ncbi:hypothetical protein PL263_04185 [Methylomonas sp. EFPC3]|uniref:DUF7673 family protein n=1 Tax=Methylomonas sp. EFPC3 TaxID=3021710 RepID=UPI002416EB65|nr:hypothetical protein [Methylomonas sp. EFPC3]WFP51228.1 hypothetical protein PL263_04185 [Methylomonas sp. EFPC3]
MNTHALGKVRPITTYTDTLKTLGQRFELLSNGYAAFSAYLGTPIQSDGEELFSSIVDEVAKLQWLSFGVCESISDLSLALSPKTGATVEAPDAEVMERFFRQVAELDAERETVTAAGLPALTRLVAIADRDTGQAGTVRAFLLGLYNGYRFPFNLTKLRGLDKDLFDDCQAVLALDARATAQEIHCYLDNGDAIFQRWAQGGAE